MSQSSRVAAYKQQYPVAKILNKTLPLSISLQDETDCFTFLADLTVPDGILTGLGLSLSGSNVLVAPGQWKIDGLNYATLITTSLPIDAQDATYSRYDVLYVDDNNQITLISGALSLTPFEPAIPDGTIKIGSVLIEPTLVTINNPVPTDYVNTTSPQTVGGIKNFMDGIQSVTRPLGDNTLNVATTQWVQNELNASAYWFVDGTFLGSGTELDKWSVNPNQVYPSQTGNAGKFLTTDGTNASWATVTSGGGTWGSITGTLSSQTDLQTALNAKQNTLGFTAENIANKATDFTTLNNTLYPTTQAVSTFVELVNTILTGMVTTTSGTTATTTSGTYRLANVTYSIGSTPTTIPAQDATLNQYSLLYISTPGTIGILNSGLAANPAVPDLPSGAVQVAIIFIQPGSVTVGGGGKKGTGTVTSVTGTNSGGFTWSITNPTTTPNISVTLRNASTSQSGQLTNTDWNTFNGKQAALSGTGFVKISGTTISYDNSTYLTTISGISAGGDLTGTYANPTVNQINGITKSFYDPTSSIQTQLNSKYDSTNPAGYITGNQTITLTGDLTGSGTNSIATTLANTAVTPGSYSAANITVDSKGRITAAANGTGGGGTVTSVSGTTNRITSTGGATPAIDISSSYIGQSSITTLGTITSGVWQGTAITDTYISSATNWNTAYSNRITSLTVTGTSGAATLASNVLNIPTYTLAGLGGISGNQTITLSGDISGSGTTAITTTIGALKVVNSMIAASTIDLTAKVTGILPVANGGTGTVSPGIVAGTNITVTGTWPNQIVNASGGGSITGSGTTNYMTKWTSSSALGNSSIQDLTTGLVASNSVTAASGLATGFSYSHTLTAAATADVLVAHDIIPTFSLGAFTLTANIGLRVQSGALAAGMIPAPGIATLTPSITGGSLVTGTTYYVKIVAVDVYGNTTTAGPEQSITIASGTSGSIVATWTRVASAFSYRVYVGTSAGVENTYFAPTSINNSPTYTITSYSNTSQTVPLANGTMITGIGADGTYNGLNIGYGKNNITNNIVFGNSSGNTFTTASHNVAIGSLAGAAITSGSDHVAIGYQAGKSLTTSGDDICIGSFAGANITTGNDNIAIGYDSGTTLISGSNNTFLGSYSGQLTTASSNTFLGFQSGQHNTSGASNVFAGVNSGITNTSGGFNTFLGNDAGYYNTTSGNNTYIGYQAGRYYLGGGGSSNQNTNGSNSILLGYQAWPLADSQTNQIVIGYAVSGQGSNTTSIGNSSTTLALLYGVINTPVGGTASKMSTHGGKIKEYFIDAGNTSTTETDLYTYTTEASMLSVNGSTIQAEYGGIFVSSATATREIKVYFGGTVIYDSGALSVTTSSQWITYISLIRVSSTVIRYMVSIVVDGVTLTSPCSAGELTGLTLSSTNILKITGQAASTGAATNDIVGKLGAVYYWPVSV